ncbi:helix-turn-helix transcriptional regulator [Amycolatopsis sp. VS8301801F10]|uniref:helix-turn-helix transcriptional regulator n=1 Tax=Amycolatopsis sp. VS8301801F10 TaxID=2652442 RepID=UPI0038FBF25B
MPEPSIGRHHAFGIRGDFGHEPRGRGLALLGERRDRGLDPVGGIAGREGSRAQPSEVGGHQLLKTGHREHRRDGGRRGGCGHHAVRQEFGRAVERARVERGWTADEAARRAGVAPKTWQRIEDGVPVRSLTIAKLDNLFGLPGGVSFDAYTGEIDAAEVFQMSPTKNTMREPERKGDPGVANPILTDRISGPGLAELRRLRDVIDGAIGALVKSERNSLAMQVAAAEESLAMAREQRARLVASVEDARHSGNKELQEKLNLTAASATDVELVAIHQFYEARARLHQFEERETDFYDPTAEESHANYLQSRIMATRASTEDWARTIIDAANNNDEDLLRRAQESLLRAEQSREVYTAELRGLTQRHPSMHDSYRVSSFNTLPTDLTGERSEHAEHREAPEQ